MGRKLVLVVLAVLFALPVWGGGRLKRGPEQNLGPDSHVVDVRSYGARCDYEGGNAHTAHTDDGVAIQAAIDAVAADYNVNTVYFPRACYTDSTILWKRGVYLKGTGPQGSRSNNAMPSGGIYCAEGMDDDCIRTEYTGQDFHWSKIMDLAVVKVRSCDSGETALSCSTGSDCTGSCSETTDTIGNGISFADPGDFDSLMEGTFIENVWVRDFPQYCIEVVDGFIGLAGFRNLHLWRCGQAAPLDGQGDDTGACGAHGANTIADCSAFTGLTLDQHFIRITSGTGSGQTRRIASNTDDEITIENPAWATNPDDTSIFNVDYGGGMIISFDDAAGNGCSIDGIGGDGNAPALLTFADKDGAQHGGVAPRCTVRHVKSEVGSGTYEQENAIRFINSGWIVTVDSVDHLNTTGGPEIYWEGAADPSHFNYRGLAGRESGASGYLILDTSGVDTAASQIQVGLGATPTSRTHEGSVPERIIVHKMADPPFACSDHWEGNTYYDTEIDEICTCKGGASDTWYPINENPGATNCDT